MQDTTGEAKINSWILWIPPTYGHASIGQPIGTYVHQLCADPGCSLEDLPGAMDDRDRWRDRKIDKVREILAVNAP